VEEAAAELAKWQTAAAVARRVPAAGAINEDAAHGFGGGGEEVRAAIPFLIFAASQPQPGFVNQRGGLQGLAWRFAGHFVRGQPFQFVIDKR